MAQTVTVQLFRRLMMGVILGGSVAAGVTTTNDTVARSIGTANTSSTSVPEAAVTVAGEAGAGSMPALAAAAGLSVSGVGRHAAWPTVSTTTGIRLATEPRAAAPGGLATVAGVSVAAVVINGHTSAHASVARASYHRHNLGRVAVRCRDGKPSAERRGVVRLAINTVVHYGQIHGSRVVGATVLVLGPADRVLRVITIATASCTTASTGSASDYAPRSAPEEPTPTAPDTTTEESEPAPAPDMVSPAPGIETAPPHDASKQRVRAPARSLLRGHVSAAR